MKTKEIQKGAFVQYKCIIDAGDETARFVIAEDYGDGRVSVKELTSITAFGFSTYTRLKSDFKLITDNKEIARLKKIIETAITPF